MKNNNPFILIADDEKEIREVLKLLLEGEGYEILSVEEDGITLTDTALIAGEAEETLAEESDALNNERPYPCDVYGSLDTAYGCELLARLCRKEELSETDEGLVNFMLRENENTLNVFLTSPLEVRAERIASRQGMSLEDAKAKAIEKDKQRAEYYNHYTFGEWGMAGTYDLCIDSSILGIEGTADFIIDFATKAGKL